jgi:hypothetical protein
MQVQMVDSLSAVLAGIDDHAIAFVEFIQLGNPVGRQQQVAK